MGQEVQTSTPLKFSVLRRHFAHLNPQEENLSDGIGSSYGVLNYKGKVWSLRHRGEKKTFVRPDDGQPTGYIDVVILHQAKVKSKSYFKAYDPGGTSEGRAPDLRFHRRHQRRLPMWRFGRALTAMVCAPCARATSGKRSPTARRAGSARTTSGWPLCFCPTRLRRYSASR
jgi:hypothetical protein